MANCRWLNADRRNCRSEEDESQGVVAYLREDGRSQFHSGESEKSNSGGVNVVFHGEESVADSGLQHRKETLVSDRNRWEREGRRGEVNSWGSEQ